MAYQPLPIETLALGSLQLDLTNYRIPTKRDDEASAIAYLVESEDVIGAARSILRGGYFDNEIPIVVKEGDRSVVLEGNRRVCALKCLAAPTLAADFEHDFRTLLKRYALEAEELPTRIRVLVAPSREAAAPHIARLHTGQSKRSWSRDQQATFYFSLLRDHTTVEDIRARYPGTDVVRFIKMAVVRRFLSEVPFDDPSLHDYVISSKLTMSAFEYAYRIAEVAEAIGIQFGSDGRLVPTDESPEKIGKSHQGADLRALEYLVNEFRAERLNTRAPEFKKKHEAHQRLLAALEARRSSADEAADPDDGMTSGGAYPNGAAAGTGAGEPHGGSSSGAQGSGPGASGTGAGPAPGGSEGSGPRGPNHPDTKATLSTAGLDLSNIPVGLQKRYREIRNLKVKEVPLAAAVHLRTVLETTAKFHFESTDTPASGELTAVMGVVHAAYASEKPIKHQLNTIRNSPISTPGSVQWFNHAAHSTDPTGVSDRHVREAWELIVPVLRRLLRSPS